MNHVLIQYKPFFYRQSIKRLIHQMTVQKADLRGSDKVRITNFLNKEFVFSTLSLKLLQLPTYFQLTLSFLLPKGSYLVVNVVPVITIK